MATAQDPKYHTLFSDIGNYITSIRDGVANEPAAKKRKLDTPSEGASPAPPPPPPAKPAPTDGAVLTIEGISFSVPQRKKFSLVFTGKSVSAATAAGAVEFGVDYDNIGSLPRASFEFVLGS